MIKAAVIGATGYAGAELARLLYGHPGAEVIRYISRSADKIPFSDHYGNLRACVTEAFSGEELKDVAAQADVVFTATPQGYLANAIDEDILAQTKIIDLSADFRLKDVSVYEKWYRLEHGAPQFLDEAVYGLCEIARDSIRKTRLLANPGCYTTCSILTLYPAVKEGLIDPDTIVIDALSGVSGAGRGAKVDNLFCEVNENMKPYGVAAHRHTPEIEQALSEAAGKPVMLTFTPHLIPVQRGILATCYATLTEAWQADAEDTLKRIYDVYEAYYGKERFIRLLPAGTYPETRWVTSGNYVDLSLQLDARTNRLIMMGALDNLVKGAAGQAVQNMNLMFGLEEDAGLKAAPLFP